MKHGGMVFILVALLLLSVIVIGGLSILSNLEQVNQNIDKITCRINAEKARQLYYQDPERYSSFDRNGNNKPCE